MKAIMKHELSLYFHSMTAYVFGAALLVVVGIGSMMYNLNASVSNFEYVLSFGSIAFVIIVPILTMRIIAEERKQKTDILLYSLPVSTTDIIAGKYLALLIVFAIPMAVVSVYPLIFSLFGDVYLLTAYGSIFAFIVLGAALIAVGVFISSLTDNIGLAAGICVAVILFNYFSVSLSEYVSSTALGSAVVLIILTFLITLLIGKLIKNEMISTMLFAVIAVATAVTYLINSTLFEGLVPNIMSKLSLFDQFSSFVNGAFDMEAMVFFISVIVFFLFLSVQSLEKRRYN